MSQTVAHLQRKAKVAGDLQTVVRTMKAMAASSIGQYEKSAQSLADYYRTVELGLSACFRQYTGEQFSMKSLSSYQAKNEYTIAVVVFGTDQGLVGQFNELVSKFAVKTLGNLSGKHRVWSVGERVRARLLDAGVESAGAFPLPKSLNGITPLVGQILIEVNAHGEEGACDELHLIYNQRTSGAAFEPVSQRLFPLDKDWQQDLIEKQWPTANLPQVVNPGLTTLSKLIREYFFVTLFRACTESLASENASRLAAMQRADKNIEELLEALRGTYHRLRQGEIDEELFDVIAGYEALFKRPQRSAST